MAKNTISTPFRDFNEKLRQTYGINLKDMANILNITSSFLCTIEKGLKPIPLEYIEKISNEFSLSKIETKLLATAIFQTNRYVIIDVNDKLWKEALEYKVNTYD